MANPFEDESAIYYVLVNDENQHSLWPVSIDIPAGWHPAYGPDVRSSCLLYIEENWIDMRPVSLIKK